MVASLLIVLTSPIVLVVAILVRLKMGSPVFFRQQRAGWHDRLFIIYKFRTMLNTLDPSGNLLSDADRLTAFGRVIRKTSIDELPQLWNVLKGDMSLVGPRPLLPQYIPRYNSMQRRRHEVKPGITGWAQISGRNSIDWDRRLALDVWYVDNWSLGLDLQILWKTVWNVLAARSIASPGHETMPEFTGSAVTGPNSSVPNDLSS